MKRAIFFTIAVLALTFASTANADSIGQERRFYIESSYDSQARSELMAVLINITPQLYIYVDKGWWDSAPREEVNKKMAEVSSEFSSRIYPTVVSVFGSEWNPGIDNDEKITVLFHPMNGEAGGYFRSNDEYLKLQISDSNEREMFYVDTSLMQSEMLKSFFAHEFVHLVTFNQKEHKQGISEDNWLDEARAEYAPTMLGYDDVFSGSYLERRVQDFSDKPTGSLVDTQNTKYDYARINLFVHYLVDYYGQNILSDSLKSAYVGVDSINYALKKGGFNKDFMQIFSDWTIAVLVDDCNYGSKYCYLNSNLSDLNILPQVNYLPVSGESTLTFAESTKNWSANWYKIIGGGSGLLKFNFVGDPKAIFKVYYITKNRAGSYKIGTMQLNASQKGGVQINNSDNSISSLFIVSHLIVGQGYADKASHDFSWSVSMSRVASGNDLNEIKRLQAIIEDLKQKIAIILAQRSGGLVVNNDYCASISGDLYIGMSGDNIRCLQLFLKGQGSDIYPEGFVTGNFASLTQQAVIRFQEKYAAEILTPLGMQKGSGYVGTQTRLKINQILSKR